MPEVVLNCAMLRGVAPYDEELKGRGSEAVIGHTIGDLFEPPEPNLPQLQKDLNRDGIVVIQNGMPQLYHSVEELQNLDIPEHVKNYILRVGHQGIFGGQASLGGVSISAVDAGFLLKQDAILSDAPLVLSIEEGKTTLVQSTNYSYMSNEDPEKKLGNIQLSLIADLTNLHPELKLNNSMTLDNVPIHLVASGDDKIINATIQAQTNVARVENPITTASILSSIRQARDDKLSVTPPETLLAVVQNPKSSPENLREVLDFMGAQKLEILHEPVVVNRLRDIIKDGEPAHRQWSAQFINEHVPTVIGDIAQKNVMAANAIINELKNSGSTLSDAALNNIVGKIPDIITQTPEHVQEDIKSKLGVSVLPDDLRGEIQLRVPKREFFQSVMGRINEVTDVGAKDTIIGIAKSNVLQCTPNNSYNDAINDLIGVMKKEFPVLKNDNELGKLEKATHRGAKSFLSSITSRFSTPFSFPSSPPSSPSPSASSLSGTPPPAIVSTPMARGFLRRQSNSWQEAVSQNGGSPVQGNSWQEAVSQNGGSPVQSNARKV